MMQIDLMRRTRAAKPRLSTTLMAAAALLAACGGGGGGSSSTPAVATVADAGSSTQVQALSVVRTAVATDRPATTAAAARFLTQATFGPVQGSGDAELVMKIGYGAWIDRQLAMPATSHRAYWEAADAVLKAGTTPSAASFDQVLESFWKQALTGPDQLRQRVAFALSEIFVVSAIDGNVGNEPRALAAWLDMLGDKGLTTYRQLLESVSLHPLMGMYLTSLHNQKANTATGSVPDENYAREVMQLFSIGLVMLNLDGTRVVIGGNTIDTYGQSDVSGMAQVFTGFSWACAATTSNCFYNGSTGGTNSVSDPDRAFKPMMAYPQYHSTTAKTFLGVTIPAQPVADPAASLKVALDTLANHPNTAPFISKQLIQRLVTSNPTPAYVSAVAAVFNNNGAGVRGDMKAVIKAILTHPAALVSDDTQGKPREPVLRLAAYLRAYTHTSDSSAYKVGNTDNASSSLGQTLLRAGSVFNFFRPEYAAPGTQAAAAGLVAPEMQLLNETSASGWVNYMRDNVSAGVGISNGTRRDLQHDWTNEMAVAGTPATLVQVVTDRLLYGQATAALKSDIAAAVTSITVPVLTANGSNQAAVNTALRSRVNAAVLLTLATPEFMNQK